MDREDIRVSKDEFKRILRRVDKSNYMDFATLEELLYAEFKSDSISFELTDYLQTELGFTCDADLSDITEEEIDGLVEVINND